MPGADLPLFTVPDGQMGVGLGIHGEPGVAEAELPPRGRPRPTTGRRRAGRGARRRQPPGRGDPQRARRHQVRGAVRGVANGGPAAARRRLHARRSRGRRAGHQPGHGRLLADPRLPRRRAGDALARPGRHPRLPQGHRHRHRLAHRAGPSTAPAATAQVARRGDARVPSLRPRTATAILAAVAAAIEDAADELGRIDAVAGDGDHGRGMVKGTSAAVRAATAADQAGAGAATVLVAAGDAWASKAGGTSGVLWGAALAAVGERLGDDCAEITGQHRGRRGACRRSTPSPLWARPSSATRPWSMRWCPFVDTLERQTDAGADLSAAWAARRRRRRPGRAGNGADLKPRVGRARPLAERSLGTPDAGALSFALCARPPARCWAGPTQSQPRPRQPGWK